MVRPKPANKRGSPEAVEKRRVARMFNDLLGDKSARNKLDGRTEKRRKRLLRELASGKARGAWHSADAIHDYLEARERFQRFFWAYLSIITIFNTMRHGHE